jgi:ABC-2 type transport system ATP-binding protein
VSGPSGSSAIPAVQVVGLTKRYNRKVKRITSAIEFGMFLDVIRGTNREPVIALDDVNFSIDPGSVFGLLGPNGAGKTTLIKILSTLVLPDSGHAYVYGIDVVKQPRMVLSKLQAVLAEGFGFERRLTGRQNLEFYSTLYGIPKEVAKKRIEELLEFCQLTDAADEMFQKYSTGMIRKLLVSRALLTDSTVMLFDEPTSGLDPATAADFKNFLRNVLVRKEGKTLIWATHNLFEAQQVCDTIGVLSKGRIVAKGTPSEIRGTVGEKINLTISVVDQSNGNSGDWAEAVSRVNGVMSMKTRRDFETGTLVLDIEATRDVDYNGLFELLNASRLKIATLESSQPSLEEAFVKLTRGSAAT